MTKLLKRIITMLLVVTCLVGTVAGCSSNSSNNDNETKEAVTTKKAEVTTTEAKTEEPTTERPTKYVPKGTTIEIPLEKADQFQDITITKGYKFVFNDIYSKEEYDSTRGSNAIRIVTQLYTEDHPEIIEELKDKLDSPGAGISASYEDNIVIEYTGDRTFSMHRYIENDVYAGFDLYEVK